MHPAHARRARATILVPREHAGAPRERAPVALARRPTGDRCREAVDAAFVDRWSPWPFGGPYWRGAAAAATALLAPLQRGAGAYSRVPGLEAPRARLELACKSARLAACCRLRRAARSAARRGRLRRSSQPRRAQAPRLLEQLSSQKKSAHREIVRCQQEFERAAQRQETPDAMGVGLGGDVRFSLPLLNECANGALARNWQCVDSS
eukprot:353839-Chlamydomonas_euryale.AAC.20